MKKIIFSSFAALSFFSFLHADAIANDCTQISNDKKRLACYDSIFMEKPKVKPSNTNFSSGPCAKRPGWTIDILKNTPIGRSHRHKVCKEKLNEVIIKSVN